MTIEELIAALRKLVGDRYFSVDRNIRCCNGVASEHWTIAVELDTSMPLIIVNERLGPKHDHSSAASTFEALRKVLTLPTVAVGSAPTETA
jgi:hypothetical protein